MGAGYIVGRDRELGALLGGLEEALSGDGRLFLVSGEPGIGKSRLADELARQARERDVRVLWGRCWEAGGAPAYWPWVQSIRSYLRDLGPSEARAHMGAGAPDFARMLPEVRELLPDLPPPPSVDPETARFRLFDATTAFLRSAAADRGLVLVLDDLHVADTPSLLLLQFLARELGEARLLVVGAYRDTELTRDHPLTSTLAELAREPVTRLHLAGLVEADVGRFIELATRVSAPAALVAAVHAETEGNPLFVGEVVRLLAAEGRLEHPPDVTGVRLAVPQGVREVIARRLGRLSHECYRVLTYASVLGREFDLDALRPVTGLEGEALLEVLEEAVSAGVLTDVPGTLGRLRFSHALVRDTLYEDVAPTRRIRLHREVGQALLFLYRDNLDRHLAEVAHHFVQGAPTGDVDRAVDFARRAGHRALGLLAYEEAVRLFDMALRALALREPVDEGTRCELLLDLGDAQARAGDFRAAKDTFVEAAGIAARAGMPERQARAALGYGGRFLWEAGRDDPRLRSILEQAVSALGDAESDLRVKLMARLAAGPLRDDPRRERRAALSLQAVEIARRLDDHDPATLAYALEGRYEAVWWPENLEERLAIAEELVRVAREVGDREREHQGRVFRCFARWELGDMAGVREELEAQSRLEGELRQPAQAWLGTTARAALATFEGRFGDAEGLVADAAEVGRRAAGPMVEVYRAVQLWALRRERGGLEEALDELGRAARAFPMYPVLRCELAHAYAELGMRSEARDQFATLAADGFAALPRTDVWILALSLLSDVAGFLGETRLGATLYGLLRPFAGRIAVSPTEACVGSVSRPLGVLAALTGRVEEAERHFADALETNLRTGGRPWAARTRLDHARMLLGRGRPGDRERAGELAAAALETAADLGMAALEARAAALLEGSGAETAGGREPADRPAVFRREGDYWSIAYDGDAFRVRDLKGLRYIARLLGEPGREYHVLDLVATERGAPPAEGGTEPSLTPSGLGDAGEILDPAAKAAYRRRLADLEEEIEEARGLGDAERAARAEEERDFLVRELAAAVGLGGRDRRAGSAAERARVSVTRAIRAAIARLREHSAALGAHLDRTIQTGTFCSYAPDPRAPPDWRL